MDSGLPKNVQEALARQAVAGPHPAADVLNAYAERSLTSAEDAQTVAHLATCATCREAVFLAASAVDVPQAVKAQAPRPTAGWWRWAVPVTALLGISAAFMVLYGPAKQETFRQAPQEARAIAPLQDNDNYSSAKQSPPSAPAVANGASAGKVEKDAEKKALDVRPDAKSARLRAPMTKAEAAPPPPAVAAQHLDGAIVGGALANSQQNAPIGGPSQRANQVMGPIQIPSNAQTDVAAAQPQSAPLEMAPSPYQVTMKSRGKRAADSAGVGALAFAPLAAQAEGQPHRAGVLSRMAATLWRITPDGHIERQIQNQWRRALNSVEKAFHVVASVQNHVWAGGKGPDLYHSSDGGENWDTIQVKTADGALNGTMRTIRADDAMHVAIVTDSGETWTTTDGGQTWQKQQ